MGWGQSDSQQNYGWDNSPEKQGVELSFNERLVIISDIFKKLRLLGCESRQSEKNERWWNKTFDSLYDINGSDLMRYDTHLRDLCVEKFGVIQL